MPSPQLRQLWSTTNQSQDHSHPPRNAHLLMKRWSVSGFRGVSWLSTAIRFPEGPRVSCPAIQHPRTIQDPHATGHKISCWSYWDPQWPPSTRSPRCDSSYWVTRKWRRHCCLASGVQGLVRTTDSTAFYSYHPNSALDHDIPWRFARFCEWVYAASSLISIISLASTLSRWTW